VEEYLDGILEETIEIGQNFTTPIDSVRFQKKVVSGEGSRFTSDIDYKNDLGPLSRKMIRHTGFEKNISKLLGKDSYENLFSSINLSKLQEDVYLSCIGGRVPIIKVLKALT
jgi:hypothetical protein